MDNFLDDMGVDSGFSDFSSQGSISDPWWGMASFALPDQMVANSIHQASDFFGIPDPASSFDSSVEGMGTSVTNYYPNTYEDDLLRFNRNELMSMGITEKDSFDLVMTHETAHRVFQNTTFDGINQGSWEEELACDYFAGLRAGMNDIDISDFRDSLANTGGSDTHPAGSLRADFIEHGKEVAEQMRSQGYMPTFDDSMDALRDYLSQKGDEIREAQNDYLG